MTVSTNDLDRLRLQTDPPADQLVRAFFSAGQQGRVYEALQQPMEQVALRADEIANFLFSGRPRPAWFDERSVQTARAVFRAHTAAIMGVLGAFSLPFCYAAAPGNKALYLSDKMRKAPGKRLMDTAQFVQAVCQPATAAAFTYAVNRTRLIHAVARWHLHSRGWNMQWGQPINQEDLVGTNLAFSYLVLLGLQQSGVLLTPSEKESFLHLWRYIGHQLHLDDELLPGSFQDARRLTAQIRARNLTYSTEGVELTRELIQFYQQATGVKDTGPIEAQLAWYLGREVSGYLGIEVAPGPYRMINFIRQTEALGQMLGRPVPGWNMFAKFKNSALQGAMD